jgi:rare lipoprotein A
MPSTSAKNCEQTGIASYYGGKFIGRPTASGEIFDAKKLTAAHKTLPFGTMVKVTNSSNNKTVIVRINDRGPFVAGRIIDLSEDAAKKIDMIQAGVQKVTIVCE